MLVYDHWQSFMGEIPDDLVEIVGVVCDASLKRVWFIVQNQLIGEVNNRLKITFDYKSLLLLDFL